MPENHDLIKPETPLQTQELTIEPEKGESKPFIASLSGPLPPPSFLREYNEIIPGAAERILVMAEKEQQHRHQSEIENINLIKDELTKESRISLIGTISALILGMTGLFIARELILNGHTWGGGIIGGGVILGIISTTISAILKRRDKLQQPSDLNGENNPPKSSDTPSLTES